MWLIGHLMSDCFLCKENFFVILAVIVSIFLVVWLFLLLVKYLFLILKTIGLLFFRKMDNYCDNGVQLARKDQIFNIQYVLYFIRKDFLSLICTTIVFKFSHQMEIFSFHLVNWEKILVNFQDPVI